MAEYRYGVTGKDRKALVTAISEILGVEQKYCGPPRYEFSIGDDYTVDRDGTLTGPENISLLAWLAEKGFERETGSEPFAGEAEAQAEAEPSPVVAAGPEGEATGAEAQTEPEIAKAKPQTEPEAAEAEPQTEPGTAEVEDQTEPEVVEAESVPGPEVADAKPHTKSEVAEAETLTETEPTEAEAQTEPETTEVESLLESDTQSEPEIMTLTIEYPLKNMTDVAVSNLRKLVASKEPLIKMALGADELPILLTDSTIQFPWFRGEINGDSAKDYAQLIVSLCETAKRKKRVTAGVIETDNPRFSLRVFMVSLGMIGPEYDAIRKRMIKPLPGESGWRFGKPKKAGDTPVEQTETEDAAVERAEAENIPVRQTEADEAPVEQAEAEGAPVEKADGE